MYEWEDDEGPSRGRSVVIGAIVVGLAALGWFVVRPALSDDDDAATSESLEFDDASSTLSAESAVTTPASVVAAASGRRRADEHGQLDFRRNDVGRIHQRTGRRAWRPRRPRLPRARRQPISPSPTALRRMQTWTRPRPMGAPPNLVRPKH